MKYSPNDFKIQRKINDSTRYEILLKQTNKPFNNINYTTEKMALKAIKFICQQNSFKNRDIKIWWDNNLVFKNEVLKIITSGLTKKEINEKISLISKKLDIIDFKFEYLKYFKNILNL